MENAVIDTTRGASPEILTEEQLAALFSVEPRTIRLWRYTRGLPHIKITSKVIRYRRRDVDTWASRHLVSQVA